MRFRPRVVPQVMAFQIAPMVDVLLVLLCFFIVTWNIARHENELDVKVPSADNASVTNPQLNQTIVNVKADGSIVLNRAVLSVPELKERLTELSDLYPNYAIIVRGDEETPYRYIAKVVDTCRAAKIWNVAFATAKVEVIAK